LCVHARGIDLLSSLATDVLFPSLTLSPQPEPSHTYSCSLLRHFFLCPIQDAFIQPVRFLPVSLIDWISDTRSQGSCLFVQTHFDEAAVEVHWQGGAPVGGYQCWCVSGLCCLVFFLLCNIAATVLKHMYLCQCSLFRPTRAKCKSFARLRAFLYICNIAFGRPVVTSVR